jgi:predicted transcriptional regulator
MTRKKNKPVSFDALVKFFIQQHHIPTKKDIEKLSDKLDRIEQMLKSLSSTSGLRHVPGGPGGRSKKRLSEAADTVLGVIKKSDKGVGLTEIGQKTGFDEKKLRNIIYRLNKAGKIRRKSRGVYVA